MRRVVHHSSLANHHGQHAVQHQQAARQTMVRRTTLHVCTCRPQGSVSRAPQEPHAAMSEAAMSGYTIVDELGNAVEPMDDMETFVNQV